jgi:hypothetical protein
MEKINIKPLNLRILFKMEKLCTSNNIECELKNDKSLDVENTNKAKMFITDILQKGYIKRSQIKYVKK